jgi:epoxyqueuosine reductase
LAEWLKQKKPGAAARGIVDTAPFLERDYARMAGLGWSGKNTMLINKQIGSFFLIASLLTDLVLDYDQPHLQSHCGTCRACLDACPTQAFPAPGILDATRCVSYLTIELRGPIPDPYKKHVQPWLFGCDICQDVCPWNRKAPAGKESSLLGKAMLSAGSLNLIELFNYTDEQWRKRFKHTSLWRAKRQGLLRNACLVLGNELNREAYPYLKKAMHDEDEGVRNAATWACQQIEAQSRKNQPALNRQAGPID